MKTTLKKQKILMLFTIFLSVFWALFGVFIAVDYINKKYIYPMPYKEYVEKLSVSYKINKYLIYSVIKTESGFNEKAISKAGAIGLMQITPSTAEYIATLKNIKNYNLFNPYENMDFGCYYLKYLYTKFNDIISTLCAYNAGEGNVFTWLNNKEYSNDKKTLTKIPFTETQQYVDRIQKSFLKYQKLYSENLDKSYYFS